LIRAFPLSSYFFGLCICGIYGNIIATEQMRGHNIEKASYCGNYYRCRRRMPVSLQRAGLEV
jgi:hypothetical protein